ncbi:hypothetical protein L204_101369 [Cryptococcus depauperatus]|nr:Atypical/ABC1/ABC1-A protein kinase [Cryptococcus depauperatus CBS 7855]
MLSAALRVIARSATIQLEEAATFASRPTTQGGTAEQTKPPKQTQTGLGKPAFFQNQTLFEQLQGNDAISSKEANLLDRYIANAPRKLPPPAPDTHPADKGKGVPLPLNLKTAGRGSFVFVESNSTSSTLTSSSNRPSPIDALINAAPRLPSPPAVDHYSSDKSNHGAGDSIVQPENPSNRSTSQDLTEPNQFTLAAKRIPSVTIPSPSPPVAEESRPEQSLPKKKEETTVATADITPPIAIAQEDEDAPVALRASKVPSSRIGRLFHYGSLAASLSWGAASETIRRSAGGSQSQNSVFMSDTNIRRLVSTLGRMRGAALKLGQFMSIQDNHMLPPEIEKVLHQVQAHANYMPDWQMSKVLSSELGSQWQDLFQSFERTPIASASIGQVHRGTWRDGREVAVKVQFPGVADSIESDLSNLSLLLKTSALLPPGLYLQNTIAVMRRELQDECNYVMEAEAGHRFSKLLKNDPFFIVPPVIDGGSTGKILTTEWMSGKPLSRVRNLDQTTRDLIGTNIIRLCLIELFEFRFMQTDPNWANFLFASSSQPQIQLIDFGASREYTKEFMDKWYRLLKSALENDRTKMKEESLALGYLTGEENELMLNAHLDSMTLVASPFSYDGPYPFAKQTITESIRALIPTMLKHRLTPPPPETYSLNRKLSGAFLMCAKLGANVDCKKLWEEHVGGYKEG